MKNGISERVKIVHLFDVPHLMKCIRNNLLNKDLNFTIDGVKRTAKWDHLIQLYKEDSEIPDSKMLPRLTDCHILPHKITKMKVKCATQVFSQRVSAVLNFLAGELNKKSMQVMVYNNFGLIELVHFILYHYQKYYLLRCININL